MIRSVAAATALTALVAGAGFAAWLEPDPSWRAAQQDLRAALRDTAGFAADPGRLDTLAVALLRVGRLDEAATLFERVLGLAPADPAASAALGRLALANDDLARAESLLARAGDDPLAPRDRFAAALRRGDWSGATDRAEAAGLGGREPQLRRLAEAGDAWRIEGPEAVTLRWVRAWPVPLVRARLAGQSVLLAVDTAAPGLLLDENLARRWKVETWSASMPVFWSGARVSARPARVARLELGDLAIGNVPAATLSLHRWSLDVNPHGEAVAGVIGLELLRRFTPTLDWKRQTLELRRAATPPPAAGARRVPFQVWGDHELTVWGSIAGGRRTAFVVQTGLPGAALAAPDEVFEEFGVRPSAMSRLVGGAGARLQGRRGSAVVVPTVSIGAVEKDKVTGLSGALDASELWRHGVRRDAVLGGDFFRGERVTIDWASRTLIVE